MKYAPGQTLGRYELLVPIAKGGMAEVWAARLRGSRGFQKIVAIKTIRAGTTDDARMEQMFLEEAALASQIHHPNVVATLELVDHEGVLYLVMEWVEGESLNLILKRAADQGGLPIPLAVNVIAQACKGLHAAHDLRDETGGLLGVVHRDVSPHNVLVTYSGIAKLVDFGIAKVAGRGSDLTEAGELKGKFAYMAPEQVSGGAIDRRTDIFGMGIVLFLATTGRHPFQGEHPAHTLQNISRKDPTEPSSLVEGYPVELERVVLKALSKHPDDRYLTAREMLTALELAMPECHEASCEMRVSELMHELFDARLRERRASLRLAQELADQAAGPGSRRSAPASSMGSLRAVSFEESMASSHATSFDDSMASSHATLASMSPSEDGVLHARTLTAPRRRAKNRGGRLFSAAFASLVVVVLSFTPHWREIASRGFAARNAVPAVLTATAVVPPTGIAVAPAATASVAAAVSAVPVGVAPRAAALVRREDEEMQRGSRDAGAPRAIPPRTRPSARSKAAQPEPAAETPLPERPPSPEGTNLWDRRF